jgi:hypothetical protein
MPLDERGDKLASGRDPLSAATGIVEDRAGERRADAAARKSLRNLGVDQREPIIFCGIVHERCFAVDDHLEAMEDGVVG